MEVEICSSTPITPDLFNSDNFSSALNSCLKNYSKRAITNDSLCIVAYRLTFTGFALCSFVTSSLIEGTFNRLYNGYRHLCGSAIVRLHTFVDPPIFTPWSRAVLSIANQRYPVIYFTPIFCGRVEHKDFQDARLALDDGLEAAFEMKQSIPLYKGEQLKLIFLGKNCS